MNPNDNENNTTPSAPQPTPPSVPQPPEAPQEPSVQPTQRPDPFAPMQQPSSPTPPDLTQPDPPVQPAPMPMAQPDPTPVQQPKSRKKLYIIIAAVVGLLAIGGAVTAFVMLSQDGDSPIQTAIDAVTGETPTVVDRPDGTLSLDTTVDGQASLKTQNISATVGQQINLSDGFSFMVSDVSPLTSFKRTFGGRESTVTPDEGNKLIKVTYVVGNREEAPATMSFSSYTFDVVGADADKQYYAETFLSSDPLLPEGYYSLSMEKLTSGMQTQFVLYYEVPKDVAIHAERTKQYKNYQTDEQIEVTGRVSLD